MVRRWAGTVRYSTDPLPSDKGRTSPGMLHEDWRNEYERMIQAFALLQRIGDRTAVP